MLALFVLCKTPDGKESYMTEDNKFESRTLSTLMDVLAVVNHLEDNLNDAKPPQVIIETSPKKPSEASYCSITPSTEKIVVVSMEEISNVSKILIERFGEADVHVVIE